jgi:hypothetical protein
MIANFNARLSLVANRITTGDKHDNSIEFLIKKNPNDHFLIVPRGDRFEVMVGSITGIQPEEVNNAVTEVSRPREEEPRRERGKAGSRSTGRKRTK